eukprot:scaffold2957_cov226-Isochrysis_galbana.AAC.4
MAPRRPGTQPTEADLTLDIGAKRARVEGEDESSTQRKFASTKGRECSKDTLGCRSTPLQYISFGCSLPTTSQEEPPECARALCCPMRPQSCYDTPQTQLRPNHLRSPTPIASQDPVPHNALDHFHPTAEELVGHDEGQAAMTTDALVRVRSLAPTSTLSTTTIPSDTHPNGFSQPVPPLM